MSYDVMLKCPTCTCEGHEHYSIDIGNYTWNVSGMYHAAAPPNIETDSILYWMNGKIAGDVIWVLKFILAEMRDAPDVFREMNPPNGWGDYEGAIRFIDGILRECETHPTWILEVT